MRDERGRDGKGGREARRGRGKGVTDGWMDEWTEGGTKGGGANEQT